MMMNPVIPPIQTQAGISAPKKPDKRQHRAGAYKGADHSETHAVAGQDGTLIEVIRQLRQKRRVGYVDQGVGQVEAQK